MRRAPSIRLLFLLLAGPATPGFGQALPFHYYTTRDGLPSNEIHVMRQDSRGYLWIGTAEGFSIYDGNAFVNYSTGDGLAFATVNDIIEDRTAQGTMWIATNGGGVNKFEDGKFTTYRMGLSFASNAVNVLFQDHAGVIWCGSDNGVFEIGNGIVREFHPETLYRGVKNILEADDSTLWIGCDPGLFRYARRSGLLEAIDIEEHENIVNTMCTDANGTVWVGTFGGNVLEIRGKAIVRRCPTGVQKAPNYYTFNDLTDDGQGNLWACTRSGLLKIPKANFSPEAIVRYTVEDGLPENGIQSLLIDREQNYWVGGGARGLAKLSQNSIYEFPVPRSYLAISSRGATCDSAGHVWIAAISGLEEIWRDGNGRWHRFLHPVGKGPGQSTPVYVCGDGKNRLWVGEYRSSLIRYIPKQQPGRESQLIRDKELLTGRDIPSGVVMVMVDRSGLLWFAAEGVTVVDPDHPPSLKRTFTAADGLPSTSIRALYQDHDGNIWFGAGYGGGIAMLPHGDWTGKITTHYGLENGLPNDYIRAFGEDDRGRLVIGTRFGGVSVLSDGRFTTYTTKDGLLSNAVWCIATDRRGTTFLGTHLGMQRFDPAGTHQFSSNTELMGNTAWACGTYNEQFVWMLTTEELKIFEYAKTVPSPSAPPVYITSVTVNGNRVGLQHPLEFSNDENNILINYVGLSFRDERANRYRYRLLDNDHEWQPGTKQTSIIYAALKPGSYRFEVTAISSEGVESLAPATLSFTILSPVWLRWWFMLLGTVALVIILAAAYRYRMNHLLAIERVRTRIASDLHDDIGASLTRIALFSEVVKDEAEKASPRLLEMAEKIGANARELLDAVGTLVWSIDPRHEHFEDVITHLKSFAQEMLSMKGIEYTINVADTVKELEPPLDARKNIMLIFKEAVSNIVKHAECRHVEIGFNLHEDVFEMTIHDDGQGLVAATPRPGHGLLNMRTRAETIGGELTLESEYGHGMSIRLKVPVGKSW